MFQVWCGTNEGEIARIHKVSGEIITMDTYHKHAITGIHFDSSDIIQRVYTTSMDTTVKMWRGGK